MTLGAVVTVALLAALPVLAAAARPAEGRVAVALEAPAEPPVETAWRPAGPAQAVAAATAYPGLGQLVVGAEWKAAAVGAAQACILGRLLLEHRWTERAEERYDETQSAADYDDYSKHYDRRQTLIWWALGVGLLSVADAYVDAHLIGFDDPAPPAGAWEGRGPGDEAGLRVGLAVRF
jgi:hypothetical protein